MRRSPKFDRRSVSGDRSAAKLPGRKSTAVRQTPLAAMLAPSVRSDNTVLHPTVKRAPAGRVSNDSTFPSSSMIPVNIALHGELIGRDRVQRDVLDADGVGAPPSANAAGHG